MSTGKKLSRRTVLGATAFALPEVTRGLAAAAGGIYRLVRAMPRAIALELIATGERFSAARAAELGLINRVTPTGGALEGLLTRKHFLIEV